MVLYDGEIEVMCVMKLVRDRLPTMDVAVARCAR